MGTRRPPQPRHRSRTPRRLTPVSRPRVPRRSSRPRRGGSAHARGAARFAAAEAGGGEAADEFLAADLDGSEPYRVGVAGGGDVVVVALEGAGRGAEEGGEGVEFGVGGVADEVGPVPAVAGPGRRVDVDGHGRPSRA